MFFSVWAHQHFAQIGDQTSFLTACLDLLSITEGKLKKKTKNPTGPAANTEICIERTALKKWYFSQGESAMTTFTRMQFSQWALWAHLLWKHLHSSAPPTRSPSKLSCISLPERASVAPWLLQEGECKAAGSSVTQGCQLSSGKLKQSPCACPADRLSAGSTCGQLLSRVFLPCSQISQRKPLWGTRRGFTPQHLKHVLGWHLSKPWPPRWVLGTALPFAEENTHYAECFLVQIIILIFSNGDWLTPCCDVDGTLRSLPFASRFGLTTFRLYKDKLHTSHNEPGWRIPSDPTKNLHTIVTGSC